MSGKIYLIPVTLGGLDYEYVVPDKVLYLTRSLRSFVTEDIRSARRYLRLIDKTFPIDESVFFELNEHTPDTEVMSLLDVVKKGTDTGLMSEAGLPGIADPGAVLIRKAHELNIRVIPLSGPSSVILALIASGMNGQQFAFHGYLPVKNDERVRKLKEIEKKDTKWRDSDIHGDTLQKPENAGFHFNSMPT